MSNLTQKIADLSPEKRALLERKLREKRAGRVTTARIPRREELSPAPLSFAQQRLWFLDQLHPGSPLYGLPAAVRLRGELDVEAFELALGEVIRRHEALRTTFRSLDGEPRQLVGEPAAPDLALADLSGFEDDRDAEARRLLVELAREPFDLAAGPLLRVLLLRLTSSEHILLVSMHHIVSDGWSLGVFLRELAASYTHFAAGAAGPVALPEPPIQYADFAVWQRRRLVGEELARLIAYWRRQLAGLDPIELPADRVLPAARRYSGGTVPITLDRGVTAALEQLAAENATTLFTVLLASFQLFLHRYTGQSDIAVGSPVANRNRKEIEGLIGFFVNTLVLRGDLSGDPSFRGLVKRLAGVTVDAQAHQDLPFEKLVEELAPDRQLDRNPLFQVMLVLQNTSLPRLELGGAILEPLEVETATAKLDLTLSLREEDGVLTGSLIYSDELFERATAERMARHLGTLLEHVARAPGLRLSQVPLLSSEEELRIRAWSRTSAGVPPPRTVHELFEEHAAATPAQPALLFEDVTLSYRELNERANRLAHHLRRLGVGPERRVALLFDRRPEMIVAILGVLKAGGAYVPLDPAVPRRRLALQLRDAGTAWAVTVAELAAALPEGVETVLLDPADAALASASSANPLPAVRAGNLAYVMYTSGSTGRPKGVAVAHGHLHAYVHGVLERIDAEERPWSYATVSTLAADLGNTSIYAALTTGGCLHLVAAERIVDGDAYTEYAERHAIDCLKIVPSHLAALLAGSRPRHVLPRRRLLVGGEAVSWALVERVRSLAPECEIYNHYGPTEATVGALATRLEGREPGVATPPIGRPLAGAEVRLLDRALAPVPAGIPGQLHLGGAGLTRGYLGRPARTAAVFIPDPAAEEPGARVYATGDLARYLGDGRVEFLGRIDRQVKVRGYRVEAGEVEAVLLAHEAVSQASVAAIGDAAAGTRLAAFYVAGGALADDELRRFCAERLPEAMVPTLWQELEALPLTANGKIDRRALAALATETARPEGATVTAPRTPMEQLLLGLWSEVLERDVQDVGADFFALGGHSLLATRLVSQVRRVCEVDLPLRGLFEAPTVAALARRLETARRREKLPAFSRVPREGELPLSFSQERLWFLHQLDPESPIFNLPYFVELSGELDVAALAWSLERVVERHEVLRTAFPAVAGRPVQKIVGPLPVELPLVDLGSLPAPARSAEEDRIQALWARRRLDLGRPPLFEAVLVRGDARRHQLLLSLHHIVSDAWSRNVLTRDLATFYRSARRGGSADLPELPFQYVDFAVGQRRFLEGGALAQQLAWWREALEGVAPLDLPTDRNRPAVRQHRGAQIPFAFGRELSEALDDLSRQQRVTLYMTLLAGLFTLLHRYTGQRDLTVGSPIANRHHGELEELIGFFVNILVMRARPSGRLSFRELLGGVRETTLGAYDHQDMPFERLVEELAPERDLSRTPLFQVLLILQNAPSTPAELPGLGLRALERETGTAKYDLTFALEESPRGLRGALEYDTELFSEVTAQRFVGHLRNLLEGIVADPAKPLAELPLLSTSECQQLLLEHNATARPYPREALVHELFEARAAAEPEAEALVFENRSLDYGELNRSANQLGRRLRELGVGPETRVGLCLGRSPEMVVAMLAVLKAGGAYVPLDPSYPEQRLALVLEDARPSVLVVGQGGQLPPHQLPVVRIDAEQDDLARRDDGDLPRLAHAENPAYVIYTSGSTGRPKGVVVAHRNVVSFFGGMDERIAGERPGVWLSATSISFDISVLEILWSLARGFKLVLLDEIRHAFDPTPAASTATSVAHPPEVLARPMEFSLFYFGSDHYLGADDKYRLVLEGAKWADRNGFSAVWTPERHFHAFGGLYPNPSVLGAALAALTENVAIRSGSVVLPLQHPARVAEEWSVVDNLSHGRVGLSFASGWQVNDFVLAPESYENRKEIMMSSIDVVRRLWRGETVRLPGPGGREVPVAIHPRPIQEELPIWMTAAGNPATFRAAGELGAGLLTHLLGQDVDELREKIVVYRDAWRAAGHAGDGHVTLMLHTFVGADMETVRRHVKQPFSDYLRSSLGLFRNFVEAMGRRHDDLTPDEEAVLLDHAFERYFETSGLMGTAESCLAQIDRLKAVGVDEVGCLIDFGIETATALEGLEHLAEVREKSAASAAEARATLAAGKPATPSDTARDFSLAAQILRHEVTHFQCTPSMARMMTLEPAIERALGRLDTMMVGGEALPPALAASLARTVPGTLHNMYGPTETTIWSTTHVVDGEEVLIGRPIANTRTYVADRHLHPVPAGVFGELLIGGEGVVRGYLDQPALTAQRFVPDPFGTEPGGRLYRTGDRTRMRSSGEIEFAGRVDHQVKIHGHRIEPGEIEAALAAHPRVDEAAVVAREERVGDPRLVAYVVPARGHRVPQVAVGAAEEERILAGHRRYVLPNGMVTAVNSEFQASLAYGEIFVNRGYMQHGITLNDGDVVVDVGANVGFFTLFAHQWARRLEVHAFEPIPPSFSVLQANVALYGLDVKTHNIGLAEREEEAEFTFYPHMSGLSGRYSEKSRDLAATRAIILDRLRDTPEAEVGRRELAEVLDVEFESETYVCRLRPLSDVLAAEGLERVDLLKIDVERAELDVLRGVRAADWPKIRQVVMEIDTRENVEAARELLQAQGFRVTVEDLVAVPGEGTNPEVYVAYLYARRAAAPAAGVGPLPAGDEAELTAAGLRGHLAATLPEYMVPSAFVLLDEMPVTPNRKIDRVALSRRPLGEAAGSRLHGVHAYKPPTTDLQRSLAELWSRLLDVEQVGIHDNFFELGGSSRLLVEARARLRSELGIEASLVDLFRDPTIATLAARLEGEEKAKPNYEATRARARQRRGPVRRRGGRR